MFSRNTSSSRAIPSHRQRAKVWNDPFVPVSIGAAQKGMQAGDELTGFKRKLAEGIWTAARVPALLGAWSLDKLGVHKQVSNRLVEPWTWTEQIVSFTEADNFLQLRAHEMAEPHFQMIAYQTKDIIQDINKSYSLMTKLWDNGLTNVKRRRLSDESLIQMLSPGQWHLPFVSREEASRLGERDAKIVSAARCARVSYNLPDTGKPSTLEDDIRIFDRLVGSNPKHMSPVEHQAQPMTTSEFSANFKGWRQFRKDIEESAR